MMNATHALGWALVHFLWQGAALAILLGISLAVTRPTAARARYTLSLLTLGAMLVLPVATGLRLYDSARPEPAAPLASMLAQREPDTRSTVSDSPAPPEITTGTPTIDQPVPQPAPVAMTARLAALRDLLNPALPWLVALWVVGVVVLSVRLAHGWIMARRLRTDGARTTSASLQQVLARLAARMRVTRPVQLLESLLVEVPAVIGWLRPVILVPASALTGLTPQQLEVLLAHELAHVRRYDYVVNVVQCVIETLLFYHPAVWWVSRRVRDEREHCCDDLVVQLCGDRHLYAAALVDMERLRPRTPRLALAATGGGGSLLNRVTRLIRPTAARSELVPRWAAGVAGVLAVTVTLLATGSDRLSGEPTEVAPAPSDTARTAPDTVLRHADPSQPLALRWDWARTQARQLGRRTYWIGYQVSRPEWLEHSVYIDRGTEVIGQDIRISGRLFGDFQGLMFRGVRLAPLTGTTDSDDIAILLGFSSDQSGKTALTHVHVASIYLPMDFRGRTLLWLGTSTDAQSLPLVEGLFASTAQRELREDIVAAVGIHGSSDAVVPILMRWLNGREPTEVRVQAAEWLGFHPTPAAVAALSRAARNDAARDVRREAAEALADNTLPAATDSTIAVAKTTSDPDARREAVEGLGQKDSERALAALVSIAQTDRDEDVQREAVETLGEMPNGRGWGAVQDIARKHARPDVRREAVETIGSSLPPAEAIPVLKAIALTDPNPDVQREAVETLGEVEHDSGNALSALTEFARTHPHSDVRREAIETIGAMAPTEQTVRLLADIAAHERSEDVQREAVQALGEIGPLGLPAVIEIARTHPSPDVRRTAIETIGEQAPAAEALDLLAQIARRDRDPDVQREAVETLGALHDDRAYNLLVEFARTHPVSDVRREAIETLGETGRTDSVMAILDGVARGAGDPDVAREAVETLGELHDTRALALIARIARTHRNLDVRREAIQTYAETASPDSALALLKSILATEAPEDVYAEVLESLEELEGGTGIPALIDAARSHPNREVRADALRRLAESDDPRAQQIFDQTLRRP
jgi:HEAT repeat protein/beta-lactamase regulating signal transducer with metallopeptidase domain